MLERHTATQRMNVMLDRAGIARPVPDRPTVDVVSPALDRRSAERARSGFARQDYGRKGRLLLCAASPELRREFETHHGGGSASNGAGESEDAGGGVALLRALELANAEWVALVHPAHFYAPAHLSDAPFATLYAPGRAIGRFEHLSLGDDGEVRRIRPEAAAPWSSLLERSDARDLFQRLQGRRSLEEWARALPAELVDVTPLHVYGYLRCVDGAALVEPVESRLPPATLRALSV